eukprot:4901607-Pleurochrysis_carterae.AAC.1
MMIAEKRSVLSFIQGGLEGRANAPQRVSQRECNYENIEPKPWEPYYSKEDQKACKERGANTEGKRLESNTGGGKSHSFAFLLLLLFPPSESDVKRRAERAFQKQMSQNMRGENSRLSDESSVRGENSGLSVESNDQSIGLSPA